MANKKRKHKKATKRSLWIAIAAVSALLVALLVTAMLLSRKEDAPGSSSSIQSTQNTTPVNPSTPSQEQDHAQTQPTTESELTDDTQPTTESEPTDDTQPTTEAQPSGGKQPTANPQPSDEQVTLDNIPTESAPLLVSEDIYIVRMANYSGRFVEDGSDAELENYCAVVVENRSEKTIQLLQFTISGKERTYSFRLTTLPPGERAIVQEINRSAVANGEVIVSVNVEAIVYFAEEPSLHEDIFTISGSENGIELRNRTNQKISGPIYVYYKTRTSNGYVGGITYRVTIPSLEANGIYEAAVNHFWPGSSQVMFIEYAQ